MNLKKLDEWIYINRERAREQYKIKPNLYYLGINDILSEIRELINEPKK